MAQDNEKGKNQALLRFQHGTGFYCRKFLKNKQKDTFFYIDQYCGSIIDAVTRKHLFYIKNLIPPKLGKTTYIYIYMYIYKCIFIYINISTYVYIRITGTIVIKIMFA